MKKEFSEILTDVKEQILYLQELGVENLSVELPEISLISDSKFQIPNSTNINSKPEIPREKLERFIPTDEILSSVLAQKQQSETPKIANDKPLASRLSRLPSLSKRETPTINFTNNPITEPKEMPKKTTEEMPALFDAPEEKLPESNETIEEIRAEIGDCKRCQLCEGRTNIVHSNGNFNAELMFVGEAPGADEDAQGLPFVGRAGQLLTKIIEAIGMKREEVLIGNINRCRPPGNRAPLPDETAACKPFLMREIAVVKPKVIVVMGNTAVKNLLGTKEGITKIRGIFQDYYGVKVMPTFHPAYLLRDPSKKREVWEDMKKVRAFLNEQE